MKLYSSRIGVGECARTTRYTVGGISEDLCVGENVNSVATFNGVSPSSGVINVSVLGVGGYADIGVIELTRSSTTNAAPTANAGPDQSVIVPGPVALSGSGTDRDGTIASYKWTEISSNYATISSPTSATTAVTDLTPGTYTFRLTVTDNDGKTGSDDVSITVGANPRNAECPAQTIVILGSSTAAGYGASDYDHSWVGKFASYAAGHSVINLAVPGYTTYHILPTGTNNGSRPAVDRTKNITAALARNPTAIVVNMPTNDAAYEYTAAETEANFRTVANLSQAAGVPVWIATTQPRNLSATGHTLLTTVRDWINTTYLGRAIDFWTTIANNQGNIAAAYDAGDGIHLNNAGHHKLFARVVNAGVLETLCGSLPVPGVRIDSVSHSATYVTGPVAPGSLAMLKGSGLAGNNVAAFFDGLPARLFYTSATQINLLVPAGLGSRTSAQVIVIADGVASAPYTAPLVAVNPGIFPTGILNENMTQNSAGNAAQAGSVAVIFATGLPATGISVRLANREITALDYAGPAPTLDGVEQINVRIPPDLAPQTAALQVCAQQVCSPAVGIAIR